MDYLPIFLDVTGRGILVDGGGTAAARRVQRALSAGARVVVFDPDPTDEVRGLFGADDLEFHDRVPVADDLDGCAVVYGASEDETRNRNLYDWSRTRGILCNIADVTDKCDFITPSIVDRSPIVVAISTAGTAPVIARILRSRIEASLPAAYGRLATFVGGFRDRIAGAIVNGRERRHFWEQSIEGPVGDLFLAGDTDKAAALMESDLADHAAGKGNATGEVYLVGAGPGDPDLLTFRALRLMQRADVVLYDRLIGKDILSFVRRDAERIYVGKLPRDHTLPQEDISQLMVRLAKAGNRVLRLKGGDPFIFGRGGEEIQVLADADIPFQVVPGVTAAAGCGAYAGIPLTHRDHAQSCVFVTAHGRNGVLDLDWDVLARPSQTVAIYMGLSHFASLVEGFANCGVDVDTPVAVIENGTLPEQKVVTGRLSDIEARLKQSGIKGPAIIIVGGVVTLRDQLNWVNTQNLSHEMALSTAKTDRL